MRATPRSNIKKNLWRFIEISLFFIVSVVGYSFLAKTNVNGKSKSREHSSREHVTENLYHQSIQALFIPSFDQTPFLKYVTILRSAQRETGDHSPFYALFIKSPLHELQRFESASPCISGISPLPSPANLFQQNSILLN